MHQSYGAVNWHHRSAFESHCATLRRTHRIPRIWITTTTNPTPAAATQQLVLTAARHSSSLLSLQLAFSSQQQSAPAALYIDVQLCTSKQLQSTETRPVWGVQINNHKQRTTTAVQLIEWQHHISYACQCVNTYTPTANIRILLLSEWLKHLYSKCIV